MSSPSSSGFWTDRRVVVTGGAGFLGRRVVAELGDDGADPSCPGSADYDLTVPGAAEDMLADHRPEPTIVHLAARVGGIGYNQAEPAPLYLANLLMGTHVIEAAPARAGVEQDRAARHGLLVPQVHAGAVPRGEPVGRLSRGDQRALRHGQEGPPVHAQVNAAQYGQRFAYLIPTNLYGPGDKFHPSVSHVIPALIKKCVEAVEAGDGQGRRCGAPGGRAASTSTSTTRPRRSCSAARVESGAVPEPINLGTDHEVTIRETVETIARLVGFDGELRWDPTKPDGQPRRRVDADACRTSCSAGGPRSAFEDGLRATIDWYLANRAEAERRRRLTSTLRGSAGGEVDGPAAIGGRAVGGGEGVDASRGR